MAEYKHTIETTRDTNAEVAVAKASIAQVIVGIAPINTLDDPQTAVNTPIMIEKLADMKENLGTCDDYDTYTLMQPYLVMQKYATSPIVMINVLDPTNTRHLTAVTSTEYDVTSGYVKIEDKGIMIDTIIVMSGETTGTAGTDYEAAFDADGYVDIAIASTGAFAGQDKVSIAYTKLNPAGVTKTDIIGGTKEDGTRTGLDLLDEIYAVHNIIPMFIGAPGFSSDPTVASVLDAKAELVGDYLNAQAFCDIECNTTVTPEGIKEAKDKLSVYGRHTVLSWPKVIVGGKAVYSSVVKMAQMQYEMNNNAGVPTSIDNVAAKIEGIVMEDGTSRIYTKKQLNNYVLAYGVTTWLYEAGWKSWGDTTAAYPDSTEPNNRSIKCVAVSNWLENRFKVEKGSMIGRDLSPANIQSIVDDFNYLLQGLTPTYLAGGKIIFDPDENPIADINNGDIVFHTEYADYVPMKYIKCVAVSNWLENRFKVEKGSMIGRDLSPANIQSIVDDFNYLLQGLTPTYLAGGKIIFDPDENPIADINNGDIVFHTEYADYVPMKYIKNRFTWNQDYITAALASLGGEE